MSGPRGDAGMTLVELLVAMAIMGVLIAVTMSTVVASQDTVVVTKQQQDLNSEARQALNRMTRDVRQASGIVAAVNPDGVTYSPTGLVAVRFTSDFDGDGCIGGQVPTPAPDPAPVCDPADYNAGNPEDITYCYQPGVEQLYIVDNQSLATPPAAGTAPCLSGEPLLAGNVVGFQVEYRSNQYRYDLAPSDGITTWNELDEAVGTVGDGDGVLNVELAEVDSIVLNMTLELDGRQQTYRTQVALRNRSR